MMKIHSWLPLIRKSAKKSHKQLKQKSPYFSKSLNQKVYVTKLFFTHIAHNERRTQKPLEQIQRLLILPLVDEIISNGEITEVRTEEEYTFYRLEKRIAQKNIAIIITTSKSGKLLLLSCFHIN